MKNLKSLAFYRYRNEVLAIFPAVLVYFALIYKFNAPNSLLFLHSLFMMYQVWRVIVTHREYKLEKVAEIERENNLNKTLQRLQNQSEYSRSRIDRLNTEVFKK